MAHCRWYQHDMNTIIIWPTNYIYTPSYSRPIDRLLPKYYLILHRIYQANKDEKIEEGTAPGSFNSSWEPAICAAAPCIEAVMANPLWAQGSLLVPGFEFLFEEVESQMANDLVGFWTRNSMIVQSINFSSFLGRHFRAADSQPQSKHLGCSIARLLKMTRRVLYNLHATRIVCHHYIMKSWGIHSADMCRHHAGTMWRGKT